MIVSGAFEALFGLSALIAPDMLVASLETQPNAAPIFLARILGTATLGLGTAALFACNDLDGRGSLAAADGLGLYNVLAAGFILWTAVGLGGAALWSAGLVHAAIGALFVYALARRAQAAER
jgi:hypothetical protein